MRRKHDAYFTNEDAVSALIKRVDIQGKIYEPCAGRGDISKHFSDIKCNDINGKWETTYDAREDIAWDNLVDIKWTISNLPFNVAYQILLQAHKRNLQIAFMLRLSFLEPTYERQKFLNKFPPSKLIVLPRYSFTENGKTDSVTCAWMLWNYWDAAPIEVVLK